MAELQSRNVEVGMSESVCPKYVEILVIRHGQTEWNVERRIQGQMDVGLNEVGRQQAFAVAERLSRECKLINAVYSSDSKRAFDTAQIIAESCGVLEVKSDRDLRERHLGDLEGLVFDEAAKINPEAYKALQSGLQIPGGGESYDQLYYRCTLALQRIANKHIGERVVVVSHGASIEALFAKARPSEDYRGKISNTSINVFHLFHNPQQPWILQSWGDVTHLNPILSSLLLDH